MALFEGTTEAVGIGMVERVLPAALEVKGTLWLLLLEMAAVAGTLTRSVSLVGVSR